MVRSWTLHVRAFVTSVVLLGVGAFFLWYVDQFYPLKRWLFWRYAGYWLLTLGWSGACLSAGHVTLRAVLKRSLPLLEHLAVAFALGVFEFQLAIFVTGLLHLYGSPLFVGLPLLFLASGARPLFHYFKRVAGHARALGAFERRPSLLGFVALGFGLVCLVALYLPILVPENASFDSRWRHMFLAEQYVVFGGIRRFPEGALFAASPQFTPLLYTWAFMIPRGLMFDRVELSAHVEYVVFLWTTLLCLPAVVRRLVPRANPALVWAARFLFPGIALYDSSLSIGGDHVGALFAAPLFLIGLRAWRALDVRLGVLLGAFIAAAACAKETTALLLASVPIGLVFVGFLRDGVRAVMGRVDKARLWGALAAGGATLFFASPHWLKNLIWYGDPFYPNLRAYFRGRPSSEESAYALKWCMIDHLWMTKPSMAGLWEALQHLVLFSFKPFTWGMHHDWPVFGSLFTLLVLALPLLKKAARIWALVGWVLLGMFVWFWGHHEERHLQAVVPWMAAAVAAIATLIWQMGTLLPRVSLLLLLGAQVVWGADVYFFPTHAMLGTAPIKSAADLIASGFEGKFKERLKLGKTQQTVGAATPSDAVLLVHESRDLVGYERTIVHDFYSESFNTDYELLGTPRKMYDQLRALGVTHLVWVDQYSANYRPLAGDISFFDFAYFDTKSKKRVSGQWVAAMPAQAPKERTSQRVAVLACGSHYPSGLYELSDLVVPRFGPLKSKFPAPREPLGEESAWSTQVFAVALDVGCSVGLSSSAQQHFIKVARGTNFFDASDGYEIWLRKR